jgi:hypothetical protein
MQTQGLSQFGPSRSFQLLATDPQADRTVNAQVAAIQASTDFSGTFSVVTAEGDKVTLSVDSEEDFRYMNYGYKAWSDDQRLEVKGESAEYSLSQTLGLTVDGDLNEQEVADLTKLFRKVKHIISNFFQGRDEQAILRTAKLADQFGNFSTLAGLDLSMDVTRSVTALAAHVVTQQMAEPVMLPSAPAEGIEGPPSPQQTPMGGETTTVGMIPPASTGAELPTESVPKGAVAVAPLYVTALAQERDQSAKLLSLPEQILKAVEGSRIDDEKMQKYLPRLLRKAMDHAGDHEAVRKNPDLIQELLDAIQKKKDERAPSSQEVLFVYSSSAQQTSASLSISA